MTRVVDREEENDSFAIEVNGICKAYGGSIALNDFTLRVRSGTTFGLLGPNGAGKSTAIRILMGLTDADAGSAQVLGHETSDRLPILRQRIGYVPELHTMYRWMTVDQLQNFVSNLYEQWDVDLAASLQKQFGLPGNRKIKQLSKGMVAKLGLLVSLSHHPELLILDEPTSGLDPVIREDFLESILQSESARGTGTTSNRTILFSSHHVDDVARIADEVGIVVGGRMVLVGEVDNIRSSVKRIRGVLPDGTLPRIEPPEMIRSQLNRREWTVTVHSFSPQVVERMLVQNELLDIQVEDLSLEDIFKDVVRGLMASGQEVTPC